MEDGLAENRTEIAAPPFPNAALWKKVGLALLPWPIAILLACIFWWPLLYGAGFIGGDTYIYFFPLKQFYAEGLSQGELWLWHPRIGNGVPVLGESQTGVFYPLYFLAYRMFDLDTAYSLVFLVHYVLAYVFTYWFGRALGFRPTSSLLCALVFIYGWFPPRSCLEWAMVTGTWLPLIALGAYRWIQTGKLRWAWLIGIAHAIQLLAGHFHLAFVTDITICLMAAMVSIPPLRWKQTVRRRLAVPLFLICGFLLAAYQLLPTWELRQRSQRAETEFIADLEYGRLPFGYLIQMVTPWSTYPQAEKIVRQYERANMIEAHFYVGLIPLALAVLLPFLGPGRRPIWPWIVIIGIGILLATGVGTPVLQHLPGFNYFRAPGRYALMSQLGFAVLAAECTDRIFPRRFWIHHLLLTLIFVLTFRDLLWVGRQVRYVSIIWPPVISRVPDSPVCNLLGPDDRVLAPAGNLLALSGAACVPPYLGMGPAEYFKFFNWDKNVFLGEMNATPETIGLIRDLGVTHVLTEAPLPKDWPVVNVFTGFDEFLHNGLGREHFKPYYLYRIVPPVERAYLQDDLGNRIADSKATITEFHPHHVQLEVVSPMEGWLVLTELMYPGWAATVDGNPVEPPPEKLFREVHVPAGHHTVRWTYVPVSFYAGLVVAGATLVVLLIASLITICLQWQRGNKLRSTGWP